MLQDELYIKLNKTWKEKFSQKNLSALSSCTLFNHAPLSASAPHCLLMKDFSDLRVAHDDFHWLCVAQPSRDSEGKSPGCRKKRREATEHKFSKWTQKISVLAPAHCWGLNLADFFLQRVESTRQHTRERRLSSAQIYHWITSQITTS